MNQNKPLRPIPDLPDFTLTDMLRAQSKNLNLGTGPVARELYVRHVPSVLHLATICSAHHEAASRLVEAAFAQALRAAHASGTRPFAWRPKLLAMTLSICMGWVADSRRVDLARALVTWLDQENAAVGMRPATPAFRAFWDLPEATQYLLWHGEVEGQTAAEISKLIGREVKDVARQMAQVPLLFRARCLQAHLAMNTDVQCRSLARLLDVVTRNGHTVVPPVLDAHLRTCGSCRTAGRELTQYGGRLPLILAQVVLPWGAEPYVESAKAHAPRAREGLAALAPARTMSRTSSGTRAQSRRLVLPPHSRTVVVGAAVGISVLAAAVVLAQERSGEHGEVPAGMATISAAAPSPSPSYRPSHEPSPPPALGPSPQPSASAAFILRTSLRDAATGDCLDIRRLPRKETEVVTTPCTSAESQQWIFDADQLLRNGAEPGLCLGGLNGSRDARLGLRTCDGGLKLDWNARGELVPLAFPGMAVTPDRGSGPDALVLRSRNGHPRQTWLAGKAETAPPPGATRSNR